MRKILISFFLIFTTYLYSTAQHSDLDSIRQELNSHATEDSTLALHLINFSLLISKQDRDSGLVYGREALRLARELKWLRGEGMTLNNLSGLMLVENRYDSAVIFALLGLKIAEEINDSMLLSRAHTMLSENYRLLNNPKNVYHAEKYLSIAEALGNDTMTLDAVVKLARVYDESEDKTKRDKMISHGLNLAAGLKDEINIARLKEQIVDDYYHQGNYREAAKGFREILAIWEKNGNGAAIAWIQTLISSSYLEWGKMDSALFFAEASLATARKYSLKKELGNAYGTLADYYYNNGNFKKALEYHLSADSVRRELDNSQTALHTERAQLQYEQAKKDAIVQAEQAMKEFNALRTRNILYFILSLFLVIAIFLFINNRQQQKAKNKVEHAYDALKSAQAQLIQKEKMASLGELTAGIAHEIQNPLNFVNNFSEINTELIDELDLVLKSGNQKEAIAIAADLKENEGKINFHGKRADSIVKGMLQHSRTPTGEKTPTDINALCDEYLRLSYHGLRSKDILFNALLETDFDPEVGKINIISQDISRVLLNLFNNAFYSVNERKRISGKDYFPKVKVGTKGNKGHVVITVEDNGTGIPEKIADKIFQPFFTTKPTGQGTGLGLSLSYDIIKSHGGEISVRSKEGIGTEFTIILKSV